MCVDHLLLILFLYMYLIVYFASQDYQLFGLILNVVQMFLYQMLIIVLVVFVHHLINVENLLEIAVDVQLNVLYIKIIYQKNFSYYKNIKKDLIKQIETLQDGE